MPLVPLILFVAGLVSASSAQSFRQTQTDDYTRYELQDPGTQSFRILYDVSATTAGATSYFNSIRRGAEPTVHRVVDLMTGGELVWEVVDGATARERGHQNANLEGRYIQARLARPVPAGGQGRIRIDKTYRDPESYWSDGDEIVFRRTLGIRRNAVVLPAGYELIGCNYPSQVVAERDGRVRISFLNPGPAGVPLEVRGRRLPSGAARPSTAATASDADGPFATQRVPTGARLDFEFPERAFQDRDIVYFLQPPETHAFRLYHDYTETRAGVDRYLNVVRAGSKASNPSALLLDTGEALGVETLRGAAITARGIDVGSPVTPETEVVVIWFEPVAEGQSVRLRIEETYTDPNRYVLAGDEFVWDRAFGRPRNTVVLPHGWYLTTNAIPAVVSEREDGRIQLRYVNDRPDQIQVFVKGATRGVREAR